MDFVNFDPAELAKFQALADRWWDPRSEFRPLHEINPLRLAWIDGLSPLVERKVLTWVAAAGSLPSRWHARAPTCWASTSRTSP